MAMLWQIALAKFHHQAYQQDTETTTPKDVIDPHLGITIMIDITTVTTKIGRGSGDLDPILIMPDIRVTVTVILTKVALDPITNPHTAAHHTTETQAHTITAGSPHTADPHPTGVSPGITVDLGHTHHTSSITKHQQDCLPALIKQPGKPRTGNTSKLPFMTHPPNAIALMNGPATQRMI